MKREILTIFLILFSYFSITVSGQKVYSCFTDGYINFHTCGDSYSFPSEANGGLGSIPPGNPGAPNYGGCWKNKNAGDRANWVIIQPTSSGLWIFNFSPSTGNVNAWMWGPFDSIPNSCDDLQNLLDCNNGTGGSPISVSTNVVAGKFYITLVANPTGTNSIITITTSAGDASLTPPDIRGIFSCMPGTFTLTASGAVPGEYYEWWSDPVGGILLKRSTDHLDSTFVTPFISSTTTYYVSKLMLMTPPYLDNCMSPRVPAPILVSRIVTSLIYHNP